MVIRLFGGPASDEPSRKYGTKLTPVHGSQHAGNEPVYTPTLLYKRHKCTYSALIVDRLAKMGKDHSLE